jgi:hypothetical protein
VVLKILGFLLATENNITHLKRGLPKYLNSPVLPSSAIILRLDFIFKLTDILRCKGKGKVRPRTSHKGPQGE